MTNTERKIQAAESADLSTTKATGHAPSCDCTTCCLVRTEAFNAIVGRATDKLCAEGDATLFDGLWVCKGCGRTFKRSPNQHIYAARKRARAAERTA
jgi:hypothetical protein